MPKMDDLRLRAIVQSEIERSITFTSSAITDIQEQALDYYHGRLFGDEVEGFSEYVSTDVRDTIESVMPELMEIFAAGDQVVRAEPVEPNDEQFADQATDYLNFVWLKDNDGFKITHDWIKDALIQKLGVIKIWWDESEKVEEFPLDQITAMELVEIEADPEVKILEKEEMTAEPISSFDDGVRYDLMIERTSMKGRVKIEGVPPEEFLISRREKTIDDPRFLCHRPRKTMTELLEMGFEREDIEDLPGDDETDYDQRVLARFGREEFQWEESTDLDWSMREVRLYECYLRVDVDDNGKAELRRIFVAGSGYKILPDPKTGELAPQIDDHPFAVFTPVRMSHKIFGLSLAELVMDVQKVKSAIVRQGLNNVYRINNSRMEISETHVGTTTIDDLLTNRPGGIVRTKTPGGLIPIPTEPIIHHLFPWLQYFDEVEDKRTPATRLSQGLDPDATQSTARGISMLLGRAQRKLSLIARVMAEMGFRVAFKKILKLLIDHQDEARVIRLRNEWVPMDPRSWNADMDITLAVGIGTGTREQQAIFMSEVLEAQRAIVEFQGGVKGPLVTLEEIYNGLDKWTEMRGFRDTELFFRDPSDPEGQQQQQQPQQPAPDPALIKVQMDGQAKQAELQLKAQRQQEELALKREEAAAEIEMKRVALERELGLKQGHLEADIAIRREAQAAKGNGVESGDTKIMESTIKDMSQSLAELGQQLANAVISLAQTSERMAEAAGSHTKPKEIVRDKKGRAIGVKTVEELQ